MGQNCSEAGARHTIPGSLWVNWDAVQVVGDQPSGWVKIAVKLRLGSLGYLPTCSPPSGVKWCGRLPYPGGLSGSTFQTPYYEMLPALDTPVKPAGVYDGAGY